MYAGERVLACDGGDAASGTICTMALLPELEVGLFVAFNCFGHGAAEVGVWVGEVLIR